ATTSARAVTIASGSGWSVTQNDWHSPQSAHWYRRSVVSAFQSSRPRRTEAISSAQPCGDVASLYVTRVTGHTCRHIRQYLQPSVVSITLIILLAYSRLGGLEGFALQKRDLFVAAFC